MGLTRFVLGTSILQGFGFGLIPLPHSNALELVETAGNMGPPGAGVQSRAEPGNVTAAEAIVPLDSAGPTAPVGDTMENPVGTALIPVACALLVPTWPMKG